MKPPANLFARQFGRNLARCRESTDLSQEELSLLAGVHRTAVGQLERGERVPRSDTLIKLAGALDVSPIVLLEGLRWRPPSDLIGHMEIAPVDGDSP